MRKLQVQTRRTFTIALAAALLLSLATGAALAGKKKCPSVVVPPDAKVDGKSYSQWSARWWQWNLELPVAGHPSSGEPGFDVRDGQQGNVWFLAAPFGTVERSVKIPQNKGLFIAVINAEASSLEAPDSGFHGDTEAEQREVAQYWADHIVDPFCIIDGDEVEDIGDYRVQSPQYRFKAPTPWIFGATGGRGTSVGDGYYVMLRPLSKGAHTIHFGGSLHFTLAEDGFDGDFPIDMTYHVTVK